MSVRPTSPHARVISAAFIAGATMALTFMPAAAQSTSREGSDSPAWRITAAILLVVFIAGVIALFLTRWRRLFSGRES